MKISKLPPGLKELAELRANESNWNSKESDIHVYALHLLFNWHNTAENYNFWLQISVGNFTPFYNCKVVNFKLKEK